MNDKKIRKQLKSSKLKKYVDDPQSLVIDELGLRHGAGRVDVAVINGLIHGYEIKGETDTLRRLPTQRDIYDSVLDRATIVATECHIDGALEVVPEWWGAIVVINKKERLEMRLLRPARKNPKQSPLALAKLLWKQEALLALEELDKADGMKSKKRIDLHTRLAEETSLKQLGAIVRNQLLRRKNWRSGD